MARSDYSSARPPASRLSPVSQLAAGTSQPQPGDQPGDQPAAPAAATIKESSTVGDYGTEDNADITASLAAPVPGERRANDFALEQINNPYWQDLHRPAISDRRDAQQQAARIRESRQQDALAEINRRQQERTRQQEMQQAEARKAEATAFEAKARATGLRTWKAPDGTIRPEVDAQGQPLYDPTDWKTAYDPKTKTFLESRRDETGATVQRDPEKLPVTYTPDGRALWQGNDLGHIDDIATTHANAAVRQAAAAEQARRRQEAADAGLSVAEQTAAERKAAAIQAKAIAEREKDAFAQMDKAGTDGQPDFMSRKAAQQAKAAQAEKAYNDLNVTASTAEADLVTTRAQTAAAKLTDVADLRRAEILRRGGNPNEDATLKAIEAARDRQGYKASQAYAAKVDEERARLALVEEMRTRPLTREEIQSQSAEIAARATSLDAERSDLDAAGATLQAARPAPGAGEEEWKAWQQKSADLQTRAQAHNAARAALAQRVNVQQAAAITVWNERDATARAAAVRTAKLTNAADQLLDEEAAANTPSAPAPGLLDSALDYVKGIHDGYAADSPATDATTRARQHAIRERMAALPPDLAARVAERRSDRAATAAVEAGTAPKPYAVLSDGSLALAPESYLSSFARNAALGKKQRQLDEAATGLVNPTRQQATMAPHWSAALDQAVKDGALTPQAAALTRSRLQAAESAADDDVVARTVDNVAFKTWLAGNTNGNALTDAAALWRNPTSGKSYDEVKSLVHEFLATDPTIYEEIANTARGVLTGAAGIATSLVGFSGMVQNQLANTARWAVGIKDRPPVAENPLYQLSQAGDAMLRASEDVRSVDSFHMALAQGIGSTLAFGGVAGAAGKLTSAAVTTSRFGGIGGRMLSVLSAGEGRAAAALPRLARILKSPGAITRTYATEMGSAGGVMLSGGAAQATQLYAEARAMGADEDTAVGVSAMGFFLGMGEAVPVMGWAKRLDKAAMPKALQIIATGLKEAAEETIQEGGSQFISNTIARTTYDKTRSLLQDVVPAAASGAVSGALFSTFASATQRMARTRRLRQIHAASSVQSDALQKADAAHAPIYQAFDPAQPFDAAAFAADWNARHGDVAEAAPGASAALTGAEGIAGAAPGAGGSASGGGGSVVQVSPSAAATFRDLAVLTPARSYNGASAVEARAAAAERDAILQSPDAYRDVENTEKTLESLDDAGIREVSAQRAALAEHSRALAHSHSLMRASVAIDAAAMEDPQARSRALAIVAMAHGATPESLPASLRDAAAADVYPGPDGSPIVRDEARTWLQTVAAPAASAVPSEAVALAQSTQAAQAAGQPPAAPPVLEDSSAPSEPSVQGSNPASAAPAPATLSAALATLPPARRATLAASVGEEKLAAVLTEADRLASIYAPLFDRISVSAKSRESAGAVASALGDGKTGLSLILGDILSPANLATFAADPRRLAAIFREEALHAAMRAAISDTRAREIWQALAPEAQTAVATVYLDDAALAAWQADPANPQTEYTLGHEFLRMVAQDRLPSGVLTEATDKTLLQQIGDALSAVLDYLRDLAKSIPDAATRSEVESLADAVAARVAALEPSSSPVASSDQSVASDSSAEKPASSPAATAAAEILRVADTKEFSQRDSELARGPRAKFARLVDAHRGELARVLPAFPGGLRVVRNNPQAQNVWSADGTALVLDIAPWLAGARVDVPSSLAALRRIGLDSAREMLARPSAQAAPESPTILDEARRVAAESAATARAAATASAATALTRSADAIAASPEAQALSDALPPETRGNPDTVTGQNNQPLPAVWTALPLDAIQASHTGDQFTPNPFYGGENTRDYQSDIEEQDKVKAIAAPGALRPNELTSDNPSSSGGAPMVVRTTFLPDAPVAPDAALPPGVQRNEDGSLTVWQAAGGNGRLQGVMLASEADRARLLERAALRMPVFGLPQQPPGSIAVRYMGDFDLRDAAQSAAYQKLVDALNTQPGKAQGAGLRGRIDARTNLRDASILLETAPARSGNPDRPYLPNGLFSTPEEMQNAVQTLAARAADYGLDKNIVSSFAADEESAGAYLRSLWFEAGLPGLRGAGALFANRYAPAGVPELLHGLARASIEARAAGAADLAEGLRQAASRVMADARSRETLPRTFAFLAAQQEMAALGMDVSGLFGVLSQIAPAENPISKERVEQINQVLLDVGRAMATSRAALAESGGGMDLFGEAPPTPDEVMQAAARESARRMGFDAITTPDDLKSRAAAPALPSPSALLPRLHALRADGARTPQRANMEKADAAQWRNQWQAHAADAILRSRQAAPQTSSAENLMPIGPVVKNTSALSKEKKAWGAAGHSIKRAVAIVNRHYRPQSFAGIPRDALLVPVPSTSGNNILPKLLAIRIQKDFGQPVFEGKAGIAMAKKQSKDKKSFFAKMADPQGYLPASDVGQLQGRKVYITEDIHNTGESWLAFARMLQSHGAQVEGAAALATVERRRTTPADTEKLSQKVAALSGEPLDAVRPLMHAIFHDSFRQLYNKASREVRNAATARRILSIGRERAASLHQISAPNRGQSGGSAATRESQRGNASAIEGVLPEAGSTDNSVAPDLAARRAARAPLTEAQSDAEFQAMVEDFFSALDEDALPPPAFTGEPANALPSSDPQSGQSGAASPAGSPSPQNPAQLAASLAAFSVARTESPGQFTLGDAEKNLSLLSPDPATRAALRAADQVRKDMGLPDAREVEQVQADARALYNADPAAAEARLLAKADDPERHGAFTDTDVALASIVMPAAMARATAPGAAPELLNQAMRLANAYRASGTATARSLAMRHDTFASPEERHRHWLSQILLTPPDAVRRDIDLAPTDAAKARTVETAAANVAALERQLLTMAADATVSSERIAKLESQLAAAQRRADSMRKVVERQGALRSEILAARQRIVETEAEIVSLNRQLAAAQSAAAAAAPALSAAQQDELYALRTQLETARAHLADSRALQTKSDILARDRGERLDKIRAAFAQMGVTLEDLFSGEVKVTLDQSAVFERLLAGLATPAERTAARMYQRGDSVNAIAAKTGLSPDRIEAIMRQLNEEFDKRWMGAITAGLSEEDLLSRPAASAPQDFDLSSRPPRTPEEARRIAEAMRKRVGIFRDASTGGREHHKARKPDMSKPEVAARFARAATAAQADFSDKLYEFWINSLLSGPLTQSANLGGNALNAFLDLTVYRVSEAALNQMLAVVGKRQADSARFGEFAWLLKGFWPGVVRGWRNAVRSWHLEASVFRHDFLGEDIKSFADEKIGRVGGPAIGGRRGRFFRIPSRILGAADDFSSTLYANMQVMAEAYRLAKSQGLRNEALSQFIANQMMDDQSPARLRAVTRAEEITFKTDLRKWGDEGGNLVEGAAKAMMAARREFKPLRWVTPFIGTVYNIFAQGMRKSLLGSLSLVWQLGKRMAYGKSDYETARRTGRLTDAQLMQRAAEQLLAFFGAVLIHGAVPGDDDDEDKGFMITGSTPWDKASAIGRDAQAQAHRIGQPPYTLRMGHLMLDYSRMEPVSTALGATVDTLRAIKRIRRNDEPAIKVLSALLGHMGSQITDKTFASGLSDMLASTQDPTNAADWAANMLTSFVPNIIRQPLRNLDPMVREKAGVESQARDLLPRFLARVLSQALPIPGMAQPRIDAWGNAQEKGGVGLLRVFLPMKISYFDHLHEADRAIAVWNRKNPEKPVFLGTPSRSYTVNKETRYMDDLTYARFCEQSGKYAASMLDGLSASDTRQPEEDTIKFIQQSVTRARAAARKKVLAEADAE